MTIIGYERADFSTKDGTKVTGVHVYVGRPAAPTLGEGSVVERVYVSDRKIEACGLDLSKAIGKEVQIYYNRYGKVASIVQI